MAQYTVFGASTPPYPQVVYPDGTPHIIVGNYFYLYGDMVTGWYSKGGRVHIPNDPNLTSAEILIKIWISTTGPVDLATAPLYEVAATTPPTGGWAEVEWPTAIAINAGDFMFVGYEFTGSKAGYYIHTPSPSDDPIRSVDDVNVYLAEALNIPIGQGLSDRGRFKIGSGSTTGDPAWYGTDVIITDVVTDPPLAEYGFNETGGTTAHDETDNSYDLTVNSSANFNMGRQSNGLHQVGGGTSNRILNSAPWLETAERTMMFWARRGTEGNDSLSRTVYLMDEPSGDTHFGIAVSNGSNVEFSAKVGGATVNITAPEVQLGSWAHYALTYDGQILSAYIDGVQVGQADAVGAIDSTNGSLYFFGEDYQQQIIDDLRFFDTALTSQEIIGYKDTPIVVVDTEPPTVPTNVHISSSHQTVNLIWDPSTDNVALQNYIVYRSSTSGFTPALVNQVGGPAQNAFTETAPVGTWYYRVAARDEEGNTSAASDEISVTTTLDVRADQYFPSGLPLTPGNPETDNLPNGITLSVIAGMTSPAQITGVRFYSPVAVASGVKIYLWNDATAAILTQQSGLSLVQGWNKLLFSSPYIATPGTDYKAGIFLPGPSVSYTALLNAYPFSRYEVGPMYSSLPEGSRFIESDNNPTTESSSWYGIDMIASSADVTDIQPFGADIVAENALTGSSGSEWMIIGAGDSTNLGFARQFSLNVGETVDFSCHGSGTVIDIYRIGYYNGFGWRKVATVSNTATLQPDPNSIPNSNGGVECSNWSTTASWEVPEEAISGLFIGVYRNAALDNASYIPFVVRNDAQAADTVYKTSDTTWALAYNYFGTPSAPYTGKSLYGSGGPLGDITSRTHAVSYHRPIVTREGIPQTYWLACEAPMIRFLERNGINVKYVASRDIDADPSVLSNSKIAISNGHDEYWSDGMRAGFESYRDNGGNLMFFSGNEVFWRTRFSEDHNTMWCYKDTAQGPNDHIAGAPLDPISWTGTWKDNRFQGRKPENTLTGTDFRMNGVNDRTVTFAQSSAAHPFWRNSGLANGNITVNGIIGFEADEMLPTQPEGSFVTLANHTINIDGARADDNGQEYMGNGDLNWGVVSQRYASGSIVVGFGTCQWSWGLDSTHDRGGNYTNTAMQQATLNLFTDLGAQPQTVMSGLVAPTAVSSLDVYGAIPISNRSGNVKVWNGTDWGAHPMKVWNGTSWVTRKAKGFDGSEFKDGKG